MMYLMLTLYFKSKNIRMKILTIFLISIMVASNAFGQEDSFIKEATDKWKNARVYTEKVAEIMPDSLYNFKPTKEEMTFGEQLIHLSGNMLWLSSTFLTNQKPKIVAKDYLGKSKSDILTLINQSFEFTAQAILQFDTARLEDKVDFAGGKLSKRQIIWLINDHLTHHRAQALVYLRLKDLAPPKYIGW